MRLLTVSEFDIRWKTNHVGRLARKEFSIASIPRFVTNWRDLRFTGLHLFNIRLGSRQTSHPKMRSRPVDPAGIAPQN